MSVLDSMPNRPLSRTEVDALGEHERMHGIYPVYGERPENRDTAYAVVLAFNETAYALAYKPNDEEWSTVEERDVESGLDGVSFGDMETVQELQSIAGSGTGAVEM